MSTAHPSRLTHVGQGTKPEHALYRCECGTVREFNRYKVASNHTRSCGCLAREIQLQSRRYSLDHGAFERDDPECRYWIGFLLADGWVRFVNRTGIVGLQLAEIDSCHVESFRRFLKTDVPITRRSGCSRGYKSGPAVRMDVHSLRLAMSLTRRGVCPKKSHLGSVPADLEDDRDAWRGLVDGDGSLMLNPGGLKKGGITRFRPVLALTGNRTVCGQFADFVRRRVGRRRRGDDNLLLFHTGSWRVAVNGLQALRMAEILYADAAVSLPRKQATADAFAALASNL